MWTRQLLFHKRNHNAFWLLQFMIVTIFVTNDTLFIFESRAARSVTCDVFENVYPGNDAYNELVCRGWYAFHDGQYQEAMFAFRRADEIDLFEFPNFKLLPILALTAARLGENHLANHFLREAELTLFIANGELLCVAENAGFALYRRGQRLPEPQPTQVIVRMCGDIYDALYSLQSIDEARWRTELNENFLRIRDLIVD